MKTIPLTQGQFSLVDDDDFAYLSQWNWCAWFNPHTKSHYAKRDSPSVNGKSSSIYMHRAIMGAVKGQEVDHENHHTLDNQRGNLRVTTRQGNSQNQRLPRNNTSGVCGVYFARLGRKWIAQVMVDGKTLHLASCAKKEDAIAAREAANIKYGFHENHGKAIA